MSNASTTLTVDVQDVGTFLFRLRTIVDQFRIEGDASRLLGGPVNDELLRAGAMAYATLKILMIKAPDGWTLDGLSPFAAEDSSAVIFHIYDSLRAAENRTLKAGADEGTADG